MIRVAQPYAAIAVIVRVFFPEPVLAPGVHPTAHVADSARVSPRATVGAFTLVGEGSTVEDGAVLHPHVFVGPDCRVGEESVVHPHVVLRASVSLGRRVIVHGHCHSKSFGAFPSVIRALKAIPNLPVAPIESSCCGMAGAFGYQAETQHVSRAMAELSGGQAWAFQSGEHAMSRLDQATRFQYVLGYVPTNTMWDGAYRTIRIVVTRPDVRVLYRRGYYAVAAEPRGGDGFGASGRLTDGLGRVADARLASGGHREPRSWWATDVRHLRGRWWTRPLQWRAGRRCRAHSLRGRRLRG